MVKSADAQHYSRLEYFSSERFAQYYQQVKAIKKCGVRKILEIGPGPGVVTQILRAAGLKVTTCDIQSDLKPDVCADVCKLPFSDNSFEFAMCCQVLEHLPFSQFSPALSELKRVAHSLLISFPIESHTFFSDYKLPGGARSSWVFHVPKIFGKKDMVDEHYWEMGRKGYLKNTIIKAIRSVGLKISADFTPAGAPNNQFFILNK